MASDVEAACLRIMNGIGVRTVDAGRAWGEGLKRLAKQLVGGAAGERERRECEREKEPHRSADIGRANLVLRGSDRDFHSVTVLSKGRRARKSAAARNFACAVLGSRAMQRMRV